MARAVDAAAAAGPTPPTRTSRSCRTVRPASTASASSATAHTTSIRMPSNLPVARRAPPHADTPHHPAPRPTEAPSACLILEDVPESSTATAAAKTRTRKPRLDRVCAEAVELARQAAEEVGDGVGEHLSVEAEAERVVTHYFDCTLSGYRGWRWAVVLSRAPRARTATVSETALLPGQEALRPPAWVPWVERLEAGEVGTNEVLPTAEDDDRLMPAYQYSDDDGV